MEGPGEVVGHADCAGDGEGRGTDGDEHAGTEGFGGEFLRHEPVDEGGVDGERHKEAGALDSEAADNNLDGVVRVGETVGELSCVRTNNQQRVGGKYPDGGHAGYGVGLGGPEDEVNCDAEAEGEGGIEPEEDDDCLV